MDYILSLFRVFGWIVGILVFQSCSEEASSVVSGPVAAKDALSTFQIADGFELEMIASEPLVSSPVDMEIDEYGRMYVVEMHGYPLDVSGSGNIILLADTSGDGIMDKRTVFMDSLILPNGIQRWKNGVLVTDAPHVLYLEDTDGDGRADKIDTVLTGFARTNPQHNMNNPIYALDNWIYIASEGVVKTRDFEKEFGDKGSEIRFPGAPDGQRLGVNANGRSSRFKPDQMWVENTSSRCQFGHTFDEWGNWFGCNNSHQGYHEIIANRYFERNPYLMATESAHSMSDHRDAAEVFPTTIHPDRQLMTDVGTMTAASGLTAYLGNAFPPPFDGKLTFITESVNNLVHVDVLRDSGVSYVASRIFPNKEFLSSTDAWSRPVNLYVGPDGALYLLDYYRRVIESPEWMSKEAIEAGNLYDGVDKGRIYRIIPKSGPKAEWMKGLRLGDAGTNELVEQLSNPNGWWRINAQRILVTRGDKAAVPLLTQYAAEAPAALARLHALWTLEGLQSLDTKLISRALKDSVAGIRTNAVKLAEIHLKEMPQLEAQLWNMENDPDPKVRLQLLLTLGYSGHPRAVQVRNNLLFRDIQNKWVQIAALSAPVQQASGLLNKVLDNYKPDEPAYASMLSRVTEMVGASASAATVESLIKKAVSLQADQPWQAAMLEGLSRGINRRKESISITANITEMLTRSFFETENNKLRYAALRTLQVTGFKDENLKLKSVERAVTIASDKNQPEQKRANAIAFMTFGDVQKHTDLLKTFMAASEKPAVQVAALHSLNAASDNEALCEYLVQQWHLLTPTVRNDAIAILMSSEKKVALLVEALEKNIIPVTDVSFHRSIAVMQTPDEKLRMRARKVFTRGRESAVDINKRFKKSLELNGNPDIGKQVFLANCAICHQVKGEMGVAIGPDLGSVRSWKKEDLLANILDPSLAIFPGFDLWDVKLTNGESIQGIIAAETSSAITLRNQGMPDRTINRQDIESMRSLNLSAMPTGLEKNINYQQMADLLAFLRQN